jgi:GrpB-like predicted nucleotidyltransferase (UPF0157 family)
MTLLGPSGLSLSGNAWRWLSARPQPRSSISARPLFRDWPRKPIIDILVTVDAVEPDDSFRMRLEAVGYILRVREPEHRMFRTAGRDVHVHVWATDHEVVTRYLVLRDWLRHDHGDRALYKQRKRKLAEVEWSDMNHYPEAKSEVIIPIMERAMWAASQRLGPWASPSPV